VATPGRGTNKREEPSVGRFGEAVEQLKWDAEVAAHRVSSVWARNPDDRAEEAQLADKMAACPHNPRNGGDGRGR